MAWAESSPLPHPEGESKKPKASALGYAQGRSCLRDNQTCARYVPWPTKRCVYLKLRLSKLYAKTGRLIDIGEE